jgi:hypothetical protein
MSFFKPAVVATALALFALPAAARADPFTSGTLTSFTPSSPWDGSLNDSPTSVSMYYDTGSALSPDYKVEADFYTGYWYDWHGQQADTEIACRFDPSTGDGYYFGFDSDIDEWTITRVNGGLANTLDVADASFLYDTTEHVEADCAGGSRTLKVDGVTVASALDFSTDSINTIGKAAYRMEIGGVDITDGDGTGIWPSNFVGTDIITD